MVEKIGPIRNPLTIIAIFAAIAEISGTVVLPFIAAANQATYVWFLIVFPILLIVLFFLTLNFNHKVLYAPSDYQNEDNFLRSLPRATFAEKVLKIEAELAEGEATRTSQLEPGSTAPHVAGAPEVPTNPPSLSYQSLVRRSPEATYILAEELIFRKLSKEYSSEIQREVKLGSLSGRYIFDGIVRDKGVTTVIEVKFVRQIVQPSMLLKELFRRIRETAKLLPSDQATNFRVLLAIASDEDTLNQDRVTAQIDLYRRDFAFPIEVRFYKLADLEREFNIGS